VNHLTLYLYAFFIRSEQCEFITGKCACHIVFLKLLYVCSYILYACKFFFQTSNGLEIITIEVRKIRTKEFRNALYLKLKRIFTPLSLSLISHIWGMYGNYGICIANNWNMLKKLWKQQFLTVWINIWSTYLYGFKVVVFVQYRISHCGLKVQCSAGIACKRQIKTCRCDTFVFYRNLF
jgi:hypothetical protein